MTSYAGPPFGWAIPEGYTFDNLGKCAACRAPIAWTITRKGNRAPLNQDGINHFATCPNADSFRKPKLLVPMPPAEDHRDPATAIRAREATIDAVTAARREWIAKAKPLLHDLAKRLSYLTSEDLFFAVQAHRMAQPVEPRSYGAVMRYGASAGWIVKTDELRRSGRAVNHARDQYVWRSLIHQGGNQ